MNAYACGVGSAEFWLMTPAETWLLFVAHGKRLRETRTMVAWHAANLMNMWVAKGQRVTVDRLLGRRNRLLDASMFADAESFKDYLNRIQEEAELDG